LQVTHPLTPSSSAFEPIHTTSPHLPAGFVPLDGKVRWEKKFASPARRMKRGLQF
jgi:hypothetical protein